MNWKPLYKGSINPPLETQVLLKARTGEIGLGIAQKDREGVYFSFLNAKEGRMWFGEPKNSFTDWAEITGP